ncbi:MAG TPA: tRNA (adenosine(37)-N6)-threonylcarbamoyltransferase complex dimerization subunit type 1 TsaB [Clostridia bacterium]|nr:tRNA (adenosine(37)-N6)-threonylcarbamoyltransferase complex dimerization subunit type 1 TsaB [Clostridia bacterium]
MKILALEFSTSQRSVAVVQPGEEAAKAGEGASHASKRLAFSEVVEAGGRATQAFALIEAALRQAQVEREQIECLAIGLGPGSYMGIRVGIALAQGWQLANGVKLLGVSSADCIAAQAQAEGVEGNVAVVIDAQRGEFYLANYAVSAKDWREVQPLRLATLDEVTHCVRAGDVPVGPEVAKWFPAGRMVFPRASMLGRIASNRTEFVSGEKMEPIYLRETTFVKAPPLRIIPD